MQEGFHTVIVGSGQAGLAAARFLSQAGDDFIMLDGEAAFGQTWRRRWGAVAAVLRTSRATTKLPTRGQPDAGNPALVNGQVVYRRTPAEMAAGLPDLLEAGTNIIGSCRGSTYEHTAVIRRAVDAFNRRHGAPGD